MKNSFITDYAEYADFRGYIKINFSSGYADYVDFKDYIKVISPLATPNLEATWKITWPVTTFTTLVLETT